MTRANVPLGNFSGGELSPLMYGRQDLPVFKRSAERLDNFIAMAQGPITFRTGSRRAHHTRGNQKAALIRFQFNDQQCYQIEVTNGAFRFYKDEGIITETPVAISAVTTGATTTITGLAVNNGDEIILSGVGGLEFLAEQSYLATAVSGTSFQITDIDGNAIDSTGSTYTSGGTIARIYEIRTPYREQDLDSFMDEDICTIQHAQNTDTMYIDHKSYEPRKLVRSGHASWALSRYSRTADPFDTAKAITAITKANPGVFSVTSHGRAVGDHVYIDDVVGMTQVNNRHYIVNTVPTSGTFTLKDAITGVVLDTTAFTTYTSGGHLEFIDGLNYPRAVTFTADSRVLHGGTTAKPEGINGSCAPDTSGPRYDNFTAGSNDTDALAFTLSPVDGQVNVIQWLNNTDKFIVAGTFGPIRRIYGASEDVSPTPTGINAKPVNGYGAALSSPVSLGSTMFYIQRGLQGIRSLDYDYSSAGYLTTDRNLVADHLSHPGLQQIAFQVGKPDVLWCTRKDGILLGLTYSNKEDISGWHRHRFGGSHVADSGATRPFARVLWVSTMARPTAMEQVWLVVERKINGVTRRSVEFITDPAIYPDIIDFYTGDELADLTAFTNVMYEVHKQAVYLDNSLTYDGRSYGLSAGATITIGDEVITSNNAVFTAGMVGREIWGAYDDNGDGGGRAVITGYNSTTSVDVDITVSFETSSLSAGKWYLTTDTVSGLQYLEGETVGVILDGGPDIDAVVDDGRITTSTQGSVITVGYRYRGIAKSLNLDLGGVSGSAQSKPRNVIETKIRFYNSVNASFGTSLYKLTPLEFRQADGAMDMPIPVFSGIQSVDYFDDTEIDKSIYIVQDSPSPCTITVLDIFTETTDE